YLFLVQNYFHDFASRDIAAILEEEVSLRLTAEEEVSLAYWTKQIPEKCWMICPGSFWQNKKMIQEDLETFLELSQEMFHPHYVILSGTDAEKKEAQALVERFANSATLLDR